MPASVTRYSSSPTSSGEGVSGAARRLRPADVRLRHVAGPVGPDGHDCRLKESRRDVDETVTVNRSWHVRKTIPIADAPDFLARRRLVGSRAKRANADDLIAVADANHERRRVSLVPRLTSRRLPARLAGALVERDDEGLAASVAVDDQQIAVKDWRATGAVLRLITESLLPQDLTIRRQGSRAFRPEMHVDAVALNDWRGRRAIVLRVKRAARPDVEDFDVHDFSSRRHVVRQQPQRYASILDRGRQPDAASRDDGR